MAEELDTDNGFNFVGLTITVGTATSDVAGMILAFDPRNAPASDNDNASVVEIVV